jgi:predicted metal-binding membrane protein
MFEAAFKRERIVVLASLGGIALLAWLGVWQLAGRMPADMMAMPDAMLSSPAVGFVFVMWVVMMVAMMTPSVAPTLLLFAQIEQEQVQPLSRTWIFLLGYLCLWLAFSALAALGQITLSNSALLSTELALNNSILGGVILFVAGVFQWTPLKSACLARCRSPQGFFITHWRDGLRGALVMGIQHGAYCVGCCWLLMVLLFILGVMNFVWMIALTILILAEKGAPAGVWVSRGAGLVFVGWGLWTLFTASPMH